MDAYAVEQLRAVRDSAEALTRHIQALKDETGTHEREFDRLLDEAYQIGACLDAIADQNGE